MKAVTRRLLRLEARFEWTVPSVHGEILERLVAGEWLSALKLLEPRERDLWLKGQSGEHRRPRQKSGPIHLTQRERLDKSLGGLPEELRYEIASRLMDAALSEESYEGCDKTTSPA